MNKSGRKSSVLWLAGLLLLLPFSVFSHPHVFMDTTARVEFDNGLPSGLVVRWKFDKFFSQMMVHDFAQTSQGPLNEQQQEQIRQGAFVNLVNYNFFTHLLSGDRAIPVTEVTDFSAEYEAGVLTYEFRIPLPQPTGPDLQTIAENGELIVGLYDDSYYSVLEFEADSLRVEGDVPAGMSNELQERPDKRYYYDLIVPRLFHIRWK
ncbi:MAG: DUF1007 family protein [Spirochaetaceae bacterium]|nr:MAG: DUF1007 family protein [Spirochaetaceae bacterium]